MKLLNIVDAFITLNSEYVGPNFEIHPFWRLGSAGNYWPQPKYRSVSVDSTPKLGQDLIITCLKPKPELKGQFSQLPVRMARANSRHVFLGLPVC